MQHCPATTSPLKCVVVSSVEQPTTAPVLPFKKAVDWKMIGASGGGCAGGNGETAARAAGTRAAAARAAAPVARGIPARGAL